MRWAATFSGSMASASSRQLQRALIVAAIERHPRQPDDGDRVARVRSGDLPVEASRLGRAGRPTARAPPGAAARSSILREHALGQQQQRGAVVEGRVDDDALQQRVKDAPQRAAPAPGRARSIRSSPSTARPRGRAATSAASWAATRARSSSSRPPSRGRPEPTLSASRSSSSSSSAPSPIADATDEPAHRGVRPGRFVAEHVVATRSTTRSTRRPREPEPVAGASPASSAPTTSWPRKWPSAKVAGLPMSWSRAASRTMGRSRRRGVDGPQRVVPEVLARDLVLGDPALRGELRRDRREEPGVAQRAAARPTAPVAASSLSSSAPMRSPERCATSSARRLRSRRASPGSIAEVEGRREPDGADHPQRVLVEPRARDRRRRAGAGPDVERAAERVDERCGRRRPVGPPHAMALTVKSRRARSSSIVVAELDPMRPAEVGVVVVGPEGRDLECLAVAADGHRAEAVLVDRAGEQLDEPLGPGVGGEVPVGGRPIEQRRRAATRRPRRRRGRRPAACSSRAPRRPPGRRRSMASGRRPAVSSGRGRGTSATPRCARPRGRA